MPVQRIYALASLIGPICPYSVVLFLFSIIHPTWSARLQSAASSAKMARLTVKVPFKFPPHQEDSPPSSHPSPLCVVFPNWSDQSSFAFLWNPFHRIHCWGGASWWRGAWGTWFGPVRGCLCCLLCPLPSVSWLVSCLYLLSAIKWRQNDRKKKKNANISKKRFGSSLLTKHQMLLKYCETWPDVSLPLSRRCGWRRTCQMGESISVGFFSCWFDY